jgi:hypothetical protein
MPLFWKHYKSDMTKFIEELKAKNPKLDDDQREGRARLWERRIDDRTQAQFDEGRVRQQPYVYQNKH